MIWVLWKNRERRGGNRSLLFGFEGEDPILRGEDSFHRGRLLLQKENLYRQKSRNALEERRGGKETLSQPTSWGSCANASERREGKEPRPGYVLRGGASTGKGLLSKEDVEVPEGSGALQ